MQISQNIGKLAILNSDSCHSFISNMLKKVELKNIQNRRLKG